MAYTKSDIYILNIINKLGGFNELSGVPVSSILPKAHLSHTKVRNSIKILQSNNYVQEGFMQRNAKTYYITEEGKELLNRLVVKGEDKNE